MGLSIQALNVLQIEGFNCCYGRVEVLGHLPWPTLFASSLKDVSRYVWKETKIFSSTNSYGVCKNAIKVIVF